MIKVAIFFKQRKDERKEIDDAGTRFQRPVVVIDSHAFGSVVVGIAVAMDGSPSEDY